MLVLVTYDQNMYKDFWNKNKSLKIKSGTKKQSFKIKSFQKNKNNFIRWKLK